MPTQKFRQAAIEHETSSEQFKELIRLVSPHDWIILATFGFILLVLLLWGIYGKVHTTVTGQGILLGTKASIFDANAPEGSTRVVSINVKPGDHIEKGDIVAYLDAPDLGKQVLVAQNYLQQLKEKYAAILANSQQEINRRQIQFEQKQTIQQEELKAHTDELAAVKDILQRKQSLVKSGIVTREEVLITLNNFYSVQKTIKDINNKIIQNQEELENFKQDWKERLLKLELQIIEAQRDLEKLKNQLTLSKIVYSPVSGIVTNIQVALGDSVKPGDPVVSIATEGVGLDALIFIPVQDGQRVKNGMKVLVSPEIVAKEKYGSLVGTVESVSNFPTSSRSMSAILHNKELVDRFMLRGVPIASRIHILADPTTYSGYKWSTTAGPEQKITPGMIVTAEIIVEKQAPITLIIPAFKKFLAGEW